MKISFVEKEEGKKIDFVRTYKGGGSWSWHSEIFGTDAIVEVC